MVDFASRRSASAAQAVGARERARRIRARCDRTLRYLAELRYQCEPGREAAIREQEERCRRRRAEALEIELLADRLSPPSARPTG